MPVALNFIELGLFCGFATMFLNYCLGKPASKEFSPYEIFSGYTIWLSKRRLKNVGLWESYYRQLNESLQGKKKYEVIEVRNDFKKMLYTNAEQFFTWERAAGMCPVCNGFWLSLILTVAYLFWHPQSGIIENIVFLAYSILISHITIRIIAKHG